MTGTDRTGAASGEHSEEQLNTREIGRRQGTSRERRTKHKGANEIKRVTPSKAVYPINVLT